MVTSEIKKVQNISLYDMIQHNNGEGFDICDEDWDWGIFIDCPNNWEECEDYYERVMLLFCLNIECVRFNSDGYSSCRVAKFIENNIKAFTEFFNDENREGYRPMDYENAQVTDIDVGED